MELTAMGGGDSDKRRVALDALPPEIRDAFDRHTVLQGLAEGDPVFDLALLIAKTAEKLKGPDPKKLSELLFNHAAQLERAKSSMAQTLEALKQHGAAFEARATELDERMAEVQTAIEKDQKLRKTAIDLLNKRASELEQAFHRLHRSKKRLGWGAILLAAGAGFVAYPFIDRLFLAPFGL
jgi:ABC-type transporter Mla subunit MlaD